MSALIIDVRLNDNGQTNIYDEVVKGLSRPVNQKTLPTILLYDEEGLRIYDEFTTHAHDYYLFPAEENLLKSHAHDIAKLMYKRHGGGNKRGVEGVILELGSGALRKTPHILSALSKIVPERTTPASITYYALDLERRELERTLDQLAASPVGVEMQGKVDTCGLWGTFEGGVRLAAEGGLRGREATSAAVLRSQSLSSGGTTPLPSSPSSSENDSIEAAFSMPDAATPETPLHVLFFGFSLGNFPRGDEVAFLQALPLRAGKGDTLLVGIDHCTDGARIERAYTDQAGIERRFILNGLKCAGGALGDESLFAREKWEYVGRYNMEEHRHESFCRSRVAQTVRDPQTKADFSFLEDELVLIQVAHKYTKEAAYRLFTEANLRPLRCWTDPDSSCALWLLERPPFNFRPFRSPASALSNTPFCVPTLEEFQEIEAAWDFIITKMIPDSLLFDKPIDLRHTCLFYTGHISTHLDIHLSNLLGEPNTEPEYFRNIFERGIDSNMDDPTQCHVGCCAQSSCSRAPQQTHPGVPEKEEDWPSHATILDFKKRVNTRLSNLYAELESGSRQLTRKVARVLFMTLEHEAWHTETLLYMLIQRAGTGTIPPSVGGFATPCWESLAEAWDATPAPISATVTLGPTTIELGHDDYYEADDAIVDVRDHEFGWDNEHPRRKVDVGEFRIEWRPVTNGEFYEFWKAAEGKVPMPKSWVMNNSKVMVRTLYGPVPMKIAHLWPVVTDYNSLSAYAIDRGGRLPTEAELRLFFDKFEISYEEGRNVGFRNWHPVPATTGGEGGGRGHNGGVWEWTSTTWEKHEGFEASLLCSRFSADFLDTNHNTVIGGSYATTPRLAERRTVRNRLQRNYRYAWIGARVVYDVRK